ncbi:MAG TPA: cyclic nucleotide-binding domain-containing protein [Terriglobia bacterium]|jgi:CRP-like cAMP-binding protein
MRKVLYLLSELDEHALDWLVAAGTREWLAPKHVLIEEGKPITVLYITLEGKFSVKTKDKVVAELEAGEVVGELSFLDSRPPVATVATLERSAVLSIPAARLRSKLKTDHVFASSFYRALGVMLATRLRDMTLTLAYGTSESRNLDVEEAGEFSPALFDRLDLAARRFQSLIEKLDMEKGRAAAVTEGVKF